jgi:hypothetical protein
VWWCALIVVASVLGFSAFQYAMPTRITSLWVLNAAGAAHFRDVFHVPVRPVEVPAFRLGFLIALALMAAAYLALLARQVVGAVLAPPALSSDVYAYVGYARLADVYHLNPYLATQKTLIALHDVTASFLHWPIASPYGPLWTLLCMGVEWPLRFAPLALSIIALKVVGALGVLFLAEGGRRLAEHLAPGAGPRTFLSLAFNPLLLVEGVSSAHNDVVMMAGVMWALVFAARGRFVASFALLGIFAAIKFLPLLLAPWVLLVAARRQPFATQLRLAAVGAVLAVSPSLLSYAAFWRGANTFAGLHGRLSVAHNDVHPMLAALVLLSAYAALTIWIARGDHARVVRAWIVQSLLVLLFATGIWFPWYLIWPLPAALVLRHGRDRAFTYVLFFAALLLTLPYVL